MDGHYIWWVDQFAAALLDDIGAPFSWWPQHISANFQYPAPTRKGVLGLYLYASDDLASSAVVSIARELQKSPRGRFLLEQSHGFVIALEDIAHFEHLPGWITHSDGDLRVKLDTEFIGAGMLSVDDLYVGNRQRDWFLGYFHRIMLSKIRQPPGAGPMAA